MPLPGPEISGSESSASQAWPSTAPQTFAPDSLSLALVTFRPGAFPSRGDGPCAAGHSSLVSTHWTT